MFILKLGAEALSLKSESLENKCKESSNTCHSDTSSTSSTLSESNGNLLENLLNGCLVESALLTDESQIKRCKSAIAPSRSNFQQNNTAICHRPRCDTAPQSSLLSYNHSQRFDNQIRKRKQYSDIDLNETLTKSILFESLSKQIQSDKQMPLPPMMSAFKSNGGTLVPQALFMTDPTKMTISDVQPTYSTLSVDEMKRLQGQINVLLKKIMQIIKSYSNYSTVSESRRFNFVSNLWYRVIVLAILQMDTDNCRFMFRLLLLSIFNGKDEIGCSRRDKILLLEKLQEYSKSYVWLKSNPELLHCILFWFFSKFGYPDAFLMSPQAVMCKINDLVINKGQLDSIVKLIHELSELTESHVRHIFCQHLPTASSMAEFLIQWT